jgi:hypothetical protein
MDTVTSGSTNPHCPGDLTIGIDTVGIHVDIRAVQGPGAMVADRVITAGPKDAYDPVLPIISRITAVSRPSPVAPILYFQIEGMSLGARSKDSSLVQVIFTGSPVR